MFIKLSVDPQEVIT